MNKDRAGKVGSSDRSMELEKEDRSQVFFFPKNNPPVSVRAASRKEAERILEEANRKEV